MSAVGILTRGIIDAIRSIKQPATPDQPKIKSIVSVRPKIRSAKKNK